MLDPRSVGYVIGLLVAILGATMLLPMAADLYAGNAHWPVFLESAILTTLAGGLIAIACANGVREGLSIRETFLLTTGVWLFLPLFGALPFVLGATEAGVVDAVFEAMSGMTTTGSTVFADLDELPRGLLLWRGLLQWFGGIGMVVVAMAFLPELRIGGMQIFRSEGFETSGKILPRATEIALRISVIYTALTGACALVYNILGMAPLDALIHSMSTLSTGGFANYDASFAAFGPGVQYAATVFMILAALPFVRYVQLVGGSARPLVSDSQIRVFLGLIVAFVAAITLWLYAFGGIEGERSLRLALFNVVSILSGTGYVSADYSLWGAFPVAIFFFIGLIGGCAGSTACSIKVFRYQLLFSSIWAQIRALHTPHGLFTPRYEGRPVSEDVLSSVMAFFMMFVLTLGVLSVLLGSLGLDLVTAVSGAATALANVGPGLGPEIGPAGNFAGLNDGAKLLMIVAMLLGRLELFTVYAILTVQFWRA